MGSILVLFAIVQKWRAKRLDATGQRSAQQNEHVIGALQAVRELLEDLESRTTRLERAFEALERQPAPRSQSEARPATNEPRQVLRLSLEQSEQSLAPQAVVPFDAFRERVFALADEGFSPIQISREVGKPTGQVELVLNLRRAGLSARG